jgi:hypothetical protein
MGASATDSIRAAEQHLATARFGLKDMDQPARARSGLFNAVVFGRAVTLALQNMRHQVEGFDEWYAPFRTKLKDDELMSYFYELRTEIEKTAKPQGGMYLNISDASFSPSDIMALPRPPGAKDFFIGDENGGSGWTVSLPDGTTEKFYLSLPETFGRIESGLMLPDAPERYRERDARELLTLYLNEMASIVEQAKNRFL